MLKTLMVSSAIGILITLSVKYYFSIPAMSWSFLGFMIMAGIVILLNSIINYEDNDDNEKKTITKVIYPIIIVGFISALGISYLPEEEKGTVFDIDNISGSILYRLDENKKPIPIIFQEDKIIIQYTNNQPFYLGIQKSRNNEYYLFNIEFNKDNIPDENGRLLAYLEIKEIERYLVGSNPYIFFCDWERSCHYTYSSNLKYPTSYTESSLKKEIADYEETDNKDNNKYHMLVNMEKYLNNELKAYPISLKTKNGFTAPEKPMYKDEDINDKLNILFVILLILNSIFSFFTRKVHYKTRTEIEHEEYLDKKRLKEEIQNDILNVEKEKIKSEKTEEELKELLETYKINHFTSYESVKRFNKLVEEIFHSKTLDFTITEKLLMTKRLPRLIDIEYKTNNRLSEESKNSLSALSDIFQDRIDKENDLIYEEADILNRHILRIANDNKKPV